MGAASSRWNLRRCRRRDLVHLGTVVLQRLPAAALLSRVHCSPGEAEPAPRPGRADSSPLVRGRRARSLVRRVWEAWAASRVVPPPTGGSDHPYRLALCFHLMQSYSGVPPAPVRMFDF
jgi:hypothetical protein